LTLKLKLLTFTNFDFILTNRLPAFAIEMWNTKRI